MFIPIHKVPADIAPKYQDFFMLVNWGGKRTVVHTPHRHAFNELIFMLNDGGTHDIDFCSYEIVAGSAHFVHAAQVHQINRTNEASGCSLLFSNDFLLNSPNGKQILDTLPFSPQITPVVQFDVQTFEQIKQILKQIEVEYTDNKPDKLDMIRSQLQVLFLYIKRHYKGAIVDSKHNNSVVQHFLELIEQRYQQNWSLPDYAAKLHISVNYLADICKRETQQTAHQHIQNRILLEAKRLLCYSTISVKEIAYQLGFEFPQSFNKLFKKKPDLTPLEFKHSFN